MCKLVTQKSLINLSSRSRDILYLAINFCAPIGSKSQSLILAWNSLLGLFYSLIHCLIYLRSQLFFWCMTCSSLDQSSFLFSCLNFQGLSVHCRDQFTPTLFYVFSFQCMFRFLLVLFSVQEYWLVFSDILFCSHCNIKFRVFLLYPKQVKGCTCSM